MEEKQLGPQWGGDAGRSATFPRAGYTGSEVSPWGAAGDGLTGEEGQYSDLLPRAKMFSPPWARTACLAFPLCTWHWKRDLVRVHHRGVMFRKPEASKGCCGTGACFLNEPPPPVTFLLFLK